MIIDEENHLAHYGVLRRSGRYPWGSGGPEHASSESFLGMVDSLKKKGISDVDIAKGMGITTTELRAAKSIAKNEQKQADIAMAQRLKEKGYSNIEIGKRMGKDGKALNESSVRALLAPGQKDKADILLATSNMLKKEVAEKGLIDIGVGVERHIGIKGISQTKLATAVAVLKEQGYEVHNIKFEQLGTGHQTEMKVLAPPGTTQKDVWMRRHEIKQITKFTDDGGRSYSGIDPPISVNQKRLAVRYKEQGGSDADGVIYVRPGVKDVSLGAARYAQVRVAVGGTHYLKGMAMYKDDLPDGVDLMFNTNKSDTGNKMDALKKMSDDPDSPFGAIIRQIKDPKTQKVSSAMNIVNEEGSWEKWSRSLSSQVLSKQTSAIAKTQLNMTFERKQSELDGIKVLTNPLVRKTLLDKFADSADSSAVHLKAAALPRQGTHVILPINSMKEGEIYAPNYRDGERVVLIRFPHGGVFEIPELVVNNRHPQAKKLLGQARDAVGINSKVAERLSGADFDGDTVLVIPNNNRQVKTGPPLAGLKGFDPKSAYPKYDGMAVMSPRTKAFEMGDVSNLITDMTIRGANTTELAAAVRHSMVVIDAEKHELNYKQSAIDNGIASLKKKYQGSARSGASTIISRAGSELRVNERKARPAALGGAVDAVTGKRVFVETGAGRTDSKGKFVPKKQKTTKLAEADDANTLSSGKPIEKVYADHSNRLKALANDARKASVNTRTTAYSPSAKNAYSNEVASLNDKLNLALRNAPLERQAQVIANAIYSQKRQANPDLEPSDLKKVKAQALTEARNRTGAQKQRITITDSEWAAIQAGAISNNKLQHILDNSDLERIKELATPKTNIAMSSIKKQRAQSMLASGYTQSEIADALGVSLSTLKRSVGGDEEE